jgi:hypothetical protein
MFPMPFSALLKDYRFHTQVFRTHVAKVHDGYMWHLQVQTTMQDVLRETCSQDMTKSGQATLGKQQRLRVKVWT